MKENAKKKEIRTKAIQLFKKNGFDQVPLTAICKAANISKNTFYYYFDSKEDLLNDMLKKGSLSEEDIQKISNLESPYEQYCALLKKHLFFFQECGKEIMKKALLRKLTQQYDQDSSNDFRRQLLKFQENLIKKAQQQNEIQNQMKPSILAKAAISMLIGLSQIWTTDEEIDFNLEEEYFKLLDALMQKSSA